MAEPCQHAWMQTAPRLRIGGIFHGLRVSSYCCSNCGVLWPGCPLPDPPHDREGYGDVAKLPSWHSRVESMRAGLRDVA